MRAGQADSSIYVSVSILSQMFGYLTSLGIDTEAVLASMGLDPSAFKDSDARIPIELYIRIEDEAARVAGDPCFGLHMGELADSGSWSVLGYMMMNCCSLGEAFEKSGKYYRIIGDLIEGKLSFRKGRVRVVLATPPNAPILSRHCFECTISSSVVMMRKLTGLDLSPLEVRFDYPEPESRMEYERVFRCPVLFGQGETSMTLDPAIAKMPILYANPSLLERIEGYAREFLADLEEKDAATRAATRLILARLADESLSIRTVASEMSMSVRTLQSRLEAEGHRFGELLSGARESLARRYLRENFSVEEITCLLGFSEPSVFRKAFKKWTGLTPGEYRERELARA
jgi:AraC-like DNA-binding protein